MEIKKINLYIGLSFILGILCPFVWLITLGLLNDLKTEKGIQIPFLKINIIIFMSTLLVGITPILLTLIQFWSNYFKGIPFYALSYLSVAGAFLVYTVIFLGYNIYVWRKLNRVDINV